MSLSLAIIGLPNCGKTTLFKALTRGEVKISPHRYSTLEPTLGKVSVPDDRLLALQKVFSAAKIVPVDITLIDYVALTAEESRQEMGSQFLNQIKECDALLVVLRAFPDPEGISPLEPLNDAQTVNLQLMLSDLKIAEAVLEKREKLIKIGQKEFQREFELLKKLKTALSQEKALRELELSGEELLMLKNYAFLSLKPIIYVLNLEEGSEALFLEGINPLYIYGKLEAELSELSEEEALVFAGEMGIKEKSLPRIISFAYQVLNLITFFTGNEKEVRAWAIKQGSTAWEAAGKVHTDLQKGFIKAEVIDWEKLARLGSLAKAREEGILRVEGKDYLIKEGELIFIRHH